MDFKGALLKPRQSKSSSSSILQDSSMEESNRNWLDLPPKLMVYIMQRIDWYDVLLNVKEVCKYWHALSKDPSIWTVIEFRRDIMLEKLMEKKGIPTYDTDKVLQKMARHVLRLSRGQLLDLSIQNFGSDGLLRYIYRRARKLRRLQLEDCFVCCYNYDFLRHDHDITLKGMIQMISNLPFLEELQLPYTRIFGKGIEIVGRCCPHLKSFTLNQRSYAYTRIGECDKQALAIAKTMPGLRNLQLFGNRMTITGLMAILNNCHYLEYLDLRQCFNIGRVLEPDDNGEVLEPDLERKLREQIKHVRFPQDSTGDFEFDDDIYDSDGHIGSDNGHIGSDSSSTEDYEIDDDWTFWQNTWAYL